MQLDENFQLSHGDVLKLTKDGGFAVMEFTRAKEKYLDNIIELCKYDSRKPDKKESSWITEKDFKSHLKFHLQTFSVVNLETNGKKKTKK